MQIEEVDIPKNVKSIGHKAFWNCPKLKRIVVQCDLDGTILNVFSSIRKAAETTGTRISGISMCINKKQRTANGFVWISESEVMLNDQ